MGELERRCRRTSQSLEQMLRLARIASPAIPDGRNKVPKLEEVRNFEEGAKQHDDSCLHGAKVPRCQDAAPRELVMSRDVDQGAQLPLAESQKLHLKASSSEPNPK